MDIGRSERLRVVAVAVVQYSTVFIIMVAVLVVYTMAGGIKSELVASLRSVVFWAVQDDRWLMPWPHRCGSAMHNGEEADGRCFSFEKWC